MAKDYAQIADDVIAGVRVFIENEAGSATKHIYDEQTLEFVKSEEVARPYPYAWW